MTETKPKCKLTGTDSNIFALVGKASRALRQAGQSGEAREMLEKVLTSHSYYEALGIIQNYVDSN